MLELYFSQMACSLASRIALMEAGIEARYRDRQIRFTNRDPATGLSTLAEDPNTLRAESALPTACTSARHVSGEGF